MKIAAVTADGINIHAHFGRAPYFEVLTIVDSQVVARERRPKPTHNGHAHSATTGHVYAPAMAAVIADCELVLARGMGEPAYRALAAAHVEPVLVQEKTIDAAVQAYLRGMLPHHPERVHEHEIAICHARIYIAPNRAYRAG